jgi:FAD/FMN-containing dehydrogenase
MAKLVAALALAAAAAAAAPQCRCLPSDACWAAVPWAALNASVSGRLAPSRDPLASACSGNAASPACAAALRASDDEFWLSAQPSGYLHTGLFSVWNISTELSSYAVLAATEEDVAATVAFAAAHNLRLVVKSTGHDWYGRSAAPGALLLWTHLLSAIAFTDAFVCEGCAPGTPPAPAVTVGAGVQFRELYTAAQAAGRLVIGGTCDSVGVGGCWLGGCYGSFSRLFGSGAANLLQARLALANGSLVTVNAAREPELFWGLRGGGLGLAGVVTSFTARAHPAPAHVTTGTATYTAPSEAAFGELAEAFLALLDAPLQSPAWGSGGFGAAQWSISVTAHGYNRAPAEWAAVTAALGAWVARDPQRRFTATVSAVTWNASGWAPGQAFPWMEAHPDREISTALLGSFTRYLPLAARGTPAGLARVARALTRALPLLPPAAGPTASAGTWYAMYDKAQAGLAPAAAADFAATALNPVQRSSSALLLAMWNVPSLPTVPAGAPALAALWPRLQNYTVRSPADALWAPCAAGAAGSEAAAAACWRGLARERVPLLQAQLRALRASLYADLPNLDPASGAQYSGSYIAETDYEDAAWQESQWGAANYQRLLAVKARYDPQGLFVCHHCVGSEAWAPPHYNCRV